ncbi:MAG: translation initiation factor IF-2 [Gemmatimonadetes bacterium]|nr:translation initiation factor IF-2 [Gemmatimonadota bacterium]
MRVLELAQDLKVETDALLHLLREMGIPVSSAGAQVKDADVAKVIAKVERERRGGKDTSEALQAAIEETATPKRRRRRVSRKKAEPEDEEEEAAAPEAEAVEEEAVEAEDVAEAAAEAEEEVEEVEEAEPEEEPVEVEAEAPETEPEPETEAAESEEEPAAERAAPEEEAEETEEVEAPAAEKPEPARKGAPESGRRLRPKPQPAASAGPGGTVRIQAEGYTSDGRRKAKQKKGKKRQRPDQDAVQENIQRVMAELKGGGGKKRRRRSARPSAEEQEMADMEAQEEAERESKTVRVAEFLTISELSELIDVTPTEIIGSAFKNLGLMVTINQRLDFDQIEMLLEEFGFEAVREEEYEGGADEDEEEEAPEDLQPRPPVVTVMGHVDHGKTLLLDRIRKSNVVAGEAGGITQHIGAYHVELDDGRTITFLDTPGHAAFTAMRARGADVTDVVILIVAADDSVMPQTIEAISHAKNAGVPLIVAINKVDLPAAQPNRVRQELLQHDVQVEEFGGQVLSAEISAKTGQGVDDLLEKILLQADLLELKANPVRDAYGTVIEAQLDVGKGPLVSVLVQKGTLRVGDDFLVGMHGGRVRALLDERGKQVKEAGPGIPVQILGSSGVPQAGDTFQVMDAEKAADISSTRQRLEREKQLRVKERGLKLGDFSQLMAEGEAEGFLPLIIKGDVDGSVQAVADALEQLGTPEVQVDIIHRGVGAVNESDVLLAETAGAVIIGFRVRPDTKARNLAERDGVDIQTYDVIYNAVDDVRSALEGMLSPEQRETILGAAEVRETFRIKGTGTIAGCYVTDGVIQRAGRVRVVRDGIVTYDGDIASLKRFKDDVREVREGFECGIGVANFNDLKIGDVLECYSVEEIARTLAGSAEGRG